nr:hypothetical protein [Frankia tisae]
MLAVGAGWPPPAAGRSRRSGRSFDLEGAPALRMKLDSAMADKKELWRAMTARHGLAGHTYREVSSWLVR